MLATLPTPTASVKLKKKRKGEMTNIEHPGAYINILISIGVLIWGVISGLVIVIWKVQKNEFIRWRAHLEKRMAEIEVGNKAGIKKEMEEPSLSIKGHEILCTKNSSYINLHFSEGVENLMKLITQRIGLLEENLILRIEKAVLQSFKNGVGKC